MDILEILKDKETKAKAKVEILCQLLLTKQISTSEIVQATVKMKDPEKATCIEALEFASKQNPSIVDEKTFYFVCQTLLEKAPRIKWESAKVIGNTAHLFPSKLDEAIKNLLVNSEFDGTVVRWAAAFALGEILKLKTKHTTDLIPVFEAIIAREEKGSIKKIYLNALKRIA